MRVVNTILISIVCLFLSNPFTLAAEKKPAKSEFITQGEFASDLITTLGWEGGLPPESKEADYLRILQGNRYFRFEAEDVFNEKTDNVTKRDIAIFGPFTGSGWVSGVAVPTTVHFKVFLPLEGAYTLTVGAKGDNQKWFVGGKEIIVNAGKKISEVVAGVVPLKAGLQEINVLMPPEGGIDYFMLEAPSFTPISPVAGWKGKAVLTLGELAEITAALLDLEKDLPDDTTGGYPLRIPVAETVSLPPAAKKTSAAYLGKFYSKQWVRADYRGAELDIPFKVEDAAVYGLKLLSLGEVQHAEIDGEKLVRQGKPYLDWVDMGYFRFEPGEHTLHLKLPINGGIDVVDLIRKKTAPKDYMAVCGMKGDPSAQLKRADEDKVLASLVERFKERK